jgi:hypothetical protein
MSGITGRQLAAGVVGTAIALSVVFALASGESAANLERKPELVDLMMNQSAQTCVIQDDPMDAAPYMDRLEYVFNHTRSETLDYLIANKTTVCLDKRLENQEGGFFDRPIQGVYYPDVNVVSLKDNGNDPANTGLFDWSAASNGPLFLKQFKDNFGGILDKYETLQQVETPLVAYKYTSSCGKSCTTTHYDWGSDSNGWHAPHALERNPQLYEAPVSSVGYNISLTP